MRAASPASRCPHPHPAKQAEGAISAPPIVEVRCQLPEIILRSLSSSDCQKMDHRLDQQLILRASPTVTAAVAHTVAAHPRSMASPLSPKTFPPAPHLRCKYNSRPSL